MKKVSRDRPLAEGIDVLVRAANKGSLRGAARTGSFVLSEPARALAEGEVLIAVADATSVALKVMKLPARPTTAKRTANHRVEEVARRIAEIELVARDIARPADHAAAPPPALTEQEERLLQGAELDTAPLRAEETPVLYRATAEYAKLLTESYTVERVAGFFGVNTSRIRQRLIGRPRTLYGIKLGKAWRIPIFQFQGRRLVPGIETVLRRMPPDLHPVAVYRWFTSPNTDLTSDETPISPLDWLRIGNPPDVAADLAADL